MSNEHPITIIVNLVEKTVPSQTVTFDQIVTLAFPEMVSNPNTTFKVTYRKAQGPNREGAMVVGDTVEVSKHDKTSFTVVHATKS